jgi:hypothetical protein
MGGQHDSNGICDGGRSFDLHGRFRSGASRYCDADACLSTDASYLSADASPATDVYLSADARLSADTSLSADASADARLSADTSADAYTDIEWPAFASLLAVALLIRSFLLTWDSRRSLAKRRFAMRLYDDTASIWPASIGRRVP